MSRDVEVPTSKFIVSIRMRWWVQPLMALFVTVAIVSIHLNMIDEDDLNLEWLGDIVAKHGWYMRSNA